MIEYKAALKLNIPQHDNIMGLSWERYQVVNCEYEFNRKTNQHGEVCSDLYGGIIRLEVADLPTDKLMAWVFDHARKYNGEVTIFDTKEETIEQVYFENARCIDFKMHYKAGRKPYSITKLVLHVNKIQIGNIHYENLS